MSKDKQARIYDLEAERDALRAEVERLRDRVAQLEAELAASNEELLLTAEVLHREPMDAHALHEVAAEIVAERDEAVAALANERGEGEPPGEGWARNDFDAEHVGVAWYRSEDRGDDDVPTHGAAVLWVYREHGDPEWTWEVERYDAHGDDYHHEAHGKAATARDGMRAADFGARGE